MLIAIGEPMMDGFKETEIAKQLGRTPSWVSERLSELRTEILLQNGLLPPLTDTEYAALKHSISLYGQQVSILVNEDLRLIDGGHRLRICDELEIPARYTILQGLNPGEQWELAVALNASRRQMTRQQKRKLIEHELMRAPDRSDRRIAAMCGVHGETVATVRAEIVDAGDAWVGGALPPLERPPDPGAERAVDAPVSVTVSGTTSTTVNPPRRVDSRGVSQPARKPKPRVPRTVASSACPGCGVPVEIIRDPDGRWRLEHQAAT